MKQFNYLEKIIGLLMLIFAIGFNLWLYRLEPTATTDPNDNTFQFALVDRTNQIWDFAAKKCSVNLLCFSSYLVDHWVPNWTEGYNLPFYYSHVPQILIVSTYRLQQATCNMFHDSCPMSLFQYYHWIIYLLLCFFPLSVFFALRAMKQSWLTAGIGALLATHLSTDGLYGLDPSSFLWRGYGLSSQLFAMIWFPLAIACSWKFFMQHETGNMKQEKNRSFFSDLSHVSWHMFLAIFFLTATTMGHLGIGIIALLSLIPLAFAHPIMLLFQNEKFRTVIEASRTQAIKLLLLLSLTIFFLSYWVIPVFLNGNYHNISFWDPVWKFNSYGAKDTMVRLFNGDLFDFGRFPWLTILIFIGAFGAIWEGLSSSLYSLALLFIFWLLFYFGRTTWGGLIDLIPGMKEFHLSRFIVGLHVAGMLLAPIGISWIVQVITKIKLRISKKYLPYVPTFMYMLIGILVCLAIFPQTIRYASYNDVLINQGKTSAALLQQDADELLARLRQLPQGRVFSGRGGAWGKDFRIAETPYYMQLSTYGVPTVLWLPETWSPNADTEQYFSEDQQKDYDLYNIRYVTAPPKQKTQPFWKLIKENPTWKIYQVPTSGYFTGGVRPTIVSTDKESFVNVIRLWIQSDDPKNGLFPELTFAKDYPKKVGLPNFKMIDEVTYQIPNGSIHNLFAEKPLYMGPGANTKVDVLSEEQDSDMIFKAKVEASKGCTECLVILKQTFHPNWKATIDGKPAKPMTVFPFYLALPLTEGTHDIVFSYQPSSLKVFLLILELFVVIALTTMAIRGKNLQKK